MLQNAKRTMGSAGFGPGDLRHVKTEDSGLYEAFSAGDITTRKASAPFINSLIDSSREASKFRERVQ
jgi:hypothetical protein